MAHVFAALESAAEQTERPSPTLRRAVGPLVVGAADDVAEAEADRVADEVIGRLQSGTGGESHVHDGCHGIARTAQAPAPGAPEVGYAGGEISEDLTSRIESRRGGGSALPGDVRRRMESGFGRSLAAVRVHTDGEAATLNRAVSARAFTTGNDIFFGAGEYAPETAAGERVLAHELAHTQERGTTSRRLNRKMWTEKQLLKETEQGAFARKAGAQKDLAKLVEEYRAIFEAHGIVSPNNVAAARDSIDLMEQIADDYLTRHTVVDQESDAEYDDKSRVRRMQGFRKFKSHLVAERIVLQDIEDGFKKSGGGLEAGGAWQVTEGETQTKLRAKYGRDTARNTFEKLGNHIASLVGPHESLQVEVEVEFPADPSGVSFVGGKISGEVENDGKTIGMKMALAITGGARVGVADLKAELGGYVSAQAKSGKDCMNLMSYELYRRGRESNTIPRDVVNAIWGGGVGKYAYDKVETWSRKLEQDLWGQDEPQPGDFATPAEYEEAHAAWEAQADDTFVESGATVAVSAQAGVKAGAAGASAEASAKASSGRRIDYTSLKARKGGAGAKNVGSDSVVSGAVRGVLGEGRGAQKSVGRSISSFSLGGAVSANAGPFKVGGGVGLDMRWMHDGSHAVGGKHTKSTLQKADLTVSGELSADMFLRSHESDLDQALKKLSLNLANWLKKPAASAAVAGAATKEQALERSEAVARAADMQETTLAHDNLAMEITKQLVEAAGGELSSSTTYSIELGFDLLSLNDPRKFAKPRFGEITIKKKSGVEIDVPGALKVTVEKSKRVVKLSFDPASGWSAK